MVLEEGEGEGVLLPPPERLEPVGAEADLLERPPLARLLLARLGTARLGAERGLLTARLGALRLPERTGELLLTGVATTGMVAPGLGTGAGAGALGTAAGTTVVAETAGARTPEEIAGAPAGLAVVTRDLGASGGDLLGGPAEAAAAAAPAFAAGSAGVLVPLGLGSGVEEEAMAGENGTRKGKLGGRAPWPHPSGDQWSMMPPMVRSV